MGDDPDRAAAETYFSDPLEVPDAAAVGRLVNAATLELLRWISREPRTYPELMEAWRTHCPRLSTWEDALAAGLVAVARDGNKGSRVATPASGCEAAGFRTGRGVEPPLGGSAPAEVAAGSTVRLTEAGEATLSDA